MFVLGDYWVLVKACCAPKVCSTLHSGQKLLWKSPKPLYFSEEPYFSICELLLRPLVLFYCGWCSLKKVSLSVSGVRVKKIFALCMKVSILFSSLNGFCATIYF